MVLKGGGFVIRERERDLWWRGMVFAEMGPIINGETTIVLDFSLIIQKIIVLVLKDQDG